MFIYFLGCHRSPLLHGFSPAEGRGLIAVTSLARVLSAQASVVAEALASER